MEVGRRLPTGTVTFLFSDIEGSTRLVQALDLAAFRQLIEQHHRLMRGAFGSHGGVERSTQGDSFLVVFADPAAAVAAAVEAQRSLATASWPEGVDVRVRMGLLSGRAILGGDDYIGPDINRAARIASAAHGGQVLISESTRALTERSLPEGVTLLDMGEHQLKDLEEPERVYQLVIDQLQSEFPPLAATLAGSQVPFQLTSFVGRRDDIVRVRALLEANHLVTLVGPGGTGKTRMATELARVLESAHSDGALFVDLAPLDSPDLVASTVARRLGIREQPERASREALEHHLASRDLLLVLDNFEHVLPASQLVAGLLTAAPGVKVLATSRSPLGLYGEQEYPVPPLSLPDLSAQEEVSSLAESDAVALFVERARAVRPEFALDNENAATIAQITVRLDGLPLAIELAASRIRLLTPQEILSRLIERHPVLSDASRGRPDRHQSLQATIDWSYDLAEPVERELFVRLCVFAGGFTHDAAADVCNPGGELGIPTLEGLDSLLAQSLIRHRAEDSVSRFGMLEVMRDYGRTRLSNSALLPEVNRRHLGYFVDLSQTAEPHLIGAEPGRWLDRVEDEHANLRLALQWAMDTGEAESGVRIAVAIWRFWFQRGHLREGRSLLERLLSMEPGVMSSTRAQGFLALGGLTFWLSDVEATQRAYASAKSIYSRLGDDAGVAEATYNLAFVPSMKGESDEARRRFEASLELAVEAEIPDLIARNQIMIGVIAVGDGEPTLAGEHFEEARRFFQDQGDHFHLAWATRGLGSVFFSLGRNASARRAYRDGLRLYDSVKNLPGIGQSLREISALMSVEGRDVEAMKLAGAAAALREAIGASAHLPERFHDVEGAARRELGDAATDAALEEGRGLPVEEAVAYAIERLEWDSAGSSP